MFIFDWLRTGGRIRIGPARQGDPMKLYQHPMSTTCRPLIMFIGDEGIECEQQVVDILAGE
jgi:hypothetical protein